MTQHQDHLIVEGEGGFYCQTCADRDAETAALRNEVTRLQIELNGANRLAASNCGVAIAQMNENTDLKIEIARLRRDNVAQLEQVGKAYFNTLTAT